MIINKSAIRVAAQFLKQAGYSDELQKGVEVEKEHANVYKYFEKFLKDKKLDMPITLDEFATMVAKAHLKEMNNYYTELAKMESGAHKEAMEFSGIGNLITPDKKLDDREIARALRLAISAEEDAVHLYELMVDAAEDKDIKKVLQDIANEEKVHIFELQTVLDNKSPDEDKYKEEGKEEVEELLK